MPSSASAEFRAGDVGFSIATQSGEAWIYGDSWINGRFIRNAITVNGNYVGTVRGVQSGHWVWPGAPYETSPGRIAMYAAEVAQVKPGIWGFKVQGGVRAEMDVTDPAHATVTQSTRPGPIWAAATATDASGQLVYSVDSLHHPHAGRPQADGSVVDVTGPLRATISGQFSVVRDDEGAWWMVGQLPFLSRRVVAYPMAGPTGPVTGSGLKLVTLPSPGPNRFTYAATIHPELGGLMTYAVNGSGPGTPYGLQNQPGFWPTALTFAKAQAAAPVLRTQATTAMSSAIASAIELWASSKQAELDKELAKAAKEHEGDETYAAGAPTELASGLTPNSGAPAFWELAGSPTSQPVGEDSDQGGDTYVVPSTRAGYARQQAAAKKAAAAARAAVAAAQARLRALAAQKAADEAAARAAERVAEARKRAAESSDDPAAQRSARNAEREAEQAKQDAESARESAKAKAEASLENAKQALERANSAAGRANGKGRVSWDFAGPGLTRQMRLIVKR